MIIDFHTHSFPDDIADRAVGRLAQSGGIPNYLDGRVDSIKASMKKAGIDYSVLLPIATKPAQHTTINKIAIETNKSFKSTGIISFGTIHPDNDDYKTIISNLAKAGVPGIKLHPVFQRTNIDDPRCLRIIECANDNDLIVSIHCGMDISFPNCDEASVERLANMIKEVPPHKLVLAHMGGWSMYDEVCDQLIGTPNVWLDTALVLKSTPDNNFLSKEKFVQMVRTHGSDHILFGTDSLTDRISCPVWWSQSSAANLGVYSDMKYRVFIIFMDGEILESLDKYTGIEFVNLIADFKAWWKDQWQQGNYQYYDTDGVTPLYETILDN